MADGVRKQRKVAEGQRVGGRMLIRQLDNGTGTGEAHPIPSKCLGRVSHGYVALFSKWRSGDTHLEKTGHTFRWLHETIGIEINGTIAIILSK